MDGGPLNVDTTMGAQSCLLETNAWRPGEQRVKGMEWIARLSMNSRATYSMTWKCFPSGYAFALISAPAPIFVCCGTLRVIAAEATAIEPQAMGPHMRQ